MKKGILLWLSIGVLSLSLPGCSGKPTLADSLPTMQSDHVAAGQDGYLKKDCIVCFSRQDLNELVIFTNNKNTEAIQHMVDRGQVVWMKKGTEVTMISQAWNGSAEFQIKSNGKLGFALGEFITSHKPE